MKRHVANAQQSGIADAVRVIDGAIEAIQGRPGLSSEAKARGVRALQKARARALSRLAQERPAKDGQP